MMILKRIVLGVAFATLTQQAYGVTSQEVFPGQGDYIVLKGIKVRKGTINTTAINIIKLDALMTENGSVGEIEKLIQDQRSIDKGLYATGYFDMLPISMSLKDPNRPGRILAAVLSMQAIPELRTENDLKRLRELSQSAHPLLKREILKVLA